MAKTANKTEAEPAPTIPMPRKPVQLDCTPAEWTRCHKDLYRKLKMAMTTGPEVGDVGVISKLVADIRAMDLIEPTRLPPAPEAPKVLTPEEKRIAAEVAERQAAAESPALMQVYNAKIARKEQMDAAKAEG